MPQTVTILVGLPGSGKSTLLKERSDSTFDDFHAGDSTAFTASRHYQALTDELRSGKNCTIADIAYCAADRLGAAEDGVKSLGKQLGIELEIKLLYFANDPDACRHNVVHRCSREHRGDYLAELKNIDFFAKSYAPPTNCMPVHTCCCQTK